MNINEQLPTFSDFKNLVNTDNFSQEDIDLQSSTCIKVGYNSFDHYLQFQYFILIKSFNFNGFSREVRDRILNLDINIADLVTKYKDKDEETFKNELQPIYDRVKLLPVDTYNRIHSFENKHVRLLFKFITDKFATDPLKKKLLNNVLLDSANQNSLSNEEPLDNLLQSITDFNNGNSFNNTKKIIDDLHPNAHYFPNKFGILIELYNRLLKLEYIETNENFIETFKCEIVKPPLKKTLWKTTLPRLLYLLYRLNDKDYKFMGVRIERIADNLFNFQKEKSDSNFRTTYHEVYENFESEVYLEKKMPDLNMLLNEILK
jgi:hypothetical protein